MRSRSPRSGSSSSTTRSAGKPSGGGRGSSGRPSGSRKAPKAKARVTRAPDEPHTLPVPTLMPAMTGKKLSEFRAAAHHLEPVVSIGKEGIHDKLLLAIDEALLAHELIKIKLPAIPADAKSTIADEITFKTASSKIALVGRVLTIYRHGRGPQAKNVRTVSDVVDQEA